MSDTSATCPHCQGSIHPQAMVCPHCGSEVSAPGPWADAAGPAPRPAPDDSPQGPGPDEDRQPTLADTGKPGGGTGEGLDDGTGSESSDGLDDGAGAEAGPPSVRPQPFSLWQQLRETIAALDGSMAWNEVWFFLMWGFLFLTYFLT